MTLLYESEIEQISLARDPKGFFRCPSPYRAKESGMAGQRLAKKTFRVCIGNENL